MAYSTLKLLKNYTILVICLKRENISFNLPNLAVHINMINSADKPILRGKHFHKEIELVYVTEGDLICEVENEQIIINKNNGLFINSHIMHNLIYKDEYCKFIYIQIDITDYINEQLPSAYKSFAGLLYSNNQKSYMPFDKASEIMELANKIQIEAENRKSCFEIYIKAYISLLIAVMYRNNLLFDLNKLQKSKNISRLIPAINYVENNFKSKIYLDDVVKILNVNKYNFCKDFKKAVGYTFVEYINLRRLAYAQHQLLKTDKNVLEIALESGFASVQYFNKCFKAYKSCTPKAYQKMYCR